MQELNRKVIVVKKYMMIFTQLMKHTQNEHIKKLLVIKERNMYKKAKQNLMI